MFVYRKTRKRRYYPINIELFKLQICFLFIKIHSKIRNFQISSLQILSNLLFLLHHIWYICEIKQQIFPIVLFILCIASLIFSTAFYNNVIYKHLFV